MTCPRCGVAQISPLTNQCELCGFSASGVAAAEPALDALEELAKTELAHHFTFDVPLTRRPRSIVYVAREPGSDRSVVLKVMVRPPDPRAEALFERVITVTGALDHPHIVPVLGFGSSPSLFWYTMPHIAGRSLREGLRDGPLERDACRTLIDEVGSALDYAHRRGVVHGNLKPENVLLDQSGGAHVCDFSVAFAVEGASPLPSQAAPGGVVPRRPAYVAPEAPAHGLRPPSVDQYALAVLAYECLIGSVPPAGAAPLISDVRTEVPLPVAHAIRRAMSAKPGERFAGVKEFVAAIDSDAATRVQGEPTGRASGHILTVPGWEPADGARTRWLIPALAALGVAAIFGLWKLTFGGGGTPPLVDSGLSTPSTYAPPAVDTSFPPASVDTAAPAAENQPLLPRRPSRRAARDPNASAAVTPSLPATAPDSAEGAPPRRSRRETAAPAEGVGHLFVNAAPWGELYVDGRLVGNTPKANLEIAAGNHRIRVVRDGYDPYERAIVVAAGETVRLTDIVLSERRP